MEDSLYVDCMASQGDHLPEWITFNSLVGEASGVISEEDGYGAEMLSNYVARLYFEYFEPSFADKYTCISRSSEEFVEVFITTGNAKSMIVLRSTALCLHIQLYMLYKL